MLTAVCVDSASEGPAGAQRSGKSVVLVFSCTFGHQGLSVKLYENNTVKAPPLSACWEEIKVDTGGYLGGTCHTETSECARSQLI